MGGAVALFTALRFQEAGDSRIRRIALLDSIALPQQLPSFIRLLRRPLIGQCVVHFLPVKLQVHSVLKQVFYDKTKIPDVLVRAYSESLATTDARAALIATANQIVPHNAAVLLERYRTLNIPVLLIWGRNDKIVPLAIGEALEEAIPNCRFVVLDKCGHAPQEECPEVTQQLLREFVEDAN